MVYVGIVCILRHLKEELAWAADKRLLVISKVKPFKFKTILYAMLCGP